MRSNSSNWRPKRKPGRTISMKPSTKRMTARSIRSLDH